MPSGPVPTVRVLDDDGTLLVVHGVSLTDVSVNFSEIGWENQLTGVNSPTGKIVLALSRFHAFSAVRILANRILVEADCNLSLIVIVVLGALGAELIEYLPPPRPHPFARWI